MYVRFCVWGRIIDDRWVGSRLELDMGLISK
jgi:hypothetical protein